TSYLWPGAGYWVYNAGDATTLSLQQNVQKLALPDPLAKASDSAAPDVTLPIVLTDASGMKDGATLETRQDAKAGFDGKLDVLEAPRPAASAWTQAFFVASDGLQMDHDAVPTATRATYDLVVARSGDAGLVTLSWNGAKLPDGYAVELVDAAGHRVDMTKQHALSFDAPAGLSTTAFHVVVRSLDGPVCVAQLDGACAASLPFDPMNLVDRML